MNQAIGMNTSVMLSHVLMSHLYPHLKLLDDFFLWDFCFNKKISESQTENMNQGKRTVEISGVIILKVLSISHISS